MFLGIDGCRAGWVGVAVTRCGRWRLDVVPALADLVAVHGDARLMLVDIPVGLHDAPGGRACDREARRRLASRRGSVFPAPCRAALEAADYPAANRESRARTGQGLSKQAWFLVPKIREADALLQAEPALRPRLRESHPELCFASLAGGRPMAAPKRSEAGRAERVALLGRYFRRSSAVLEHALEAHPRRALAADDVLDALCLAVSARMAVIRGRLRTVPEAPERDPKGLPMEMVYAEP